MLTKSSRIGLAICALVMIGAAVASAQVGTISGTITPTNSEATVIARSIGGSDYQEVAADPSTGFYLIAGLSDGDYELTVDAPGYVVQVAIVTISYGAPIAQDFALQAAGSISGSITPVGARAAVEATDSSTGATFGVFADTSDGSFLITQLPPGTYRLCVTPESAYLVCPCEEDVVVTAGQVSSGHGFTLSLGGRITGSVTPVPANGGVFALPANAMNMSDCAAVSQIDPTTGSYSLVGLPSGTYNLAFMASGYIRDAGVYTGVVTSTLTSQDIADITSMISSWVQANEALNPNAVLSLVTDDFVDIPSGLSKTQIAPLVAERFAELQSFSMTCSADVVRGVSGVSAVVVIQTDRNYTPTSGPPFSKPVQGQFTLTKASGSWLFNSSNSWEFSIVYEPLDGETTPVIVEYQQDPTISNITVTVGQETQVPTWTLRPAQ